MRFERDAFFMNQKHSVTARVLKSRLALERDLDRIANQH